MFPLKSAIMDFEMHYKEYAPLKSLLYYITITCLVLHYFSNLRYFGWREGIFAPFRGFFLVTMATGHHFEFFFDIFKAINMYTFYLDTSHWFESQFKIFGITLHVLLHDSSTMKQLLGKFNLNFCTLAIFPPLEINRLVLVDKILTFRHSIPYTVNSFVFFIRYSCND